jgi:hypothetical protein
VSVASAAAALLGSPCAQLQTDTPAALPVQAAWLQEFAHKCKDISRVFRCAYQLLVLAAGRRSFGQVAHVCLAAGHHPQALLAAAAAAATQVWTELPLPNPD